MDLDGCRPRREALPSWPPEASADPQLRRPRRPLLRTPSVETETGESGWIEALPCSAMLKRPSRLIRSKVALEVSVGLQHYLRSGSGWWDCVQGEERKNLSETHPRRSRSSSDRFTIISALHFLFDSLLLCLAGTLAVPLSSVVAKGATLCMYDGETSAMTRAYFPLPHRLSTDSSSSLHWRDLGETAESFCTDDLRERRNASRNRIISSRRSTS